MSRSGHIPPDPWRVLVKALNDNYLETHKGLCPVPVQLQVIGWFVSEATMSRSGATGQDTSKDKRAVEA